MRDSRHGCERIREAMVRPKQAIKQYVEANEHANVFPACSVTISKMMKKNIGGGSGVNGVANLEGVK